MRCAQGLYERGFITYMRTDSIHLSAEALNGARAVIEKKYGKDYLPDKPRIYKGSFHLFAGDGTYCVRTE